MLAMHKLIYHGPTFEVSNGLIEFKINSIITNGQIKVKPIEITDAQIIILSSV
jgi:hypothetical protein